METINNNNSKLILIAEDSAIQAKHMKFILETYNYKVIVANNGKEALELVDKYKPSLVISDIIMPELNGYELCRALKSNESTKDIPVILITALSSSDDMLESLTYNADSFISKPINKNSLIAHIECTLERRELIKNGHTEIDLEVSVGNKIRSIKSNPAKMLTMLISTYDAAAHKNRELLQTQEEMRSLNEHLEELVEERTTELSLANAQKDKFFSIIAHDLISPFEGFINLTELMANDIENFTLSELIENCKSLNETAKNLYQLLRNLLEWAHLQKDNIRYTPKSLSLSNLVSDCIGTINQKAMQKGITIINEVPETKIVYADEKMISTVLRNLLCNAVKFTRRDGKVFVRTKETKRGIVEISVTDTGVGMTEENIKKLFKIEEKIRSEGTEGEYGSGLGLLLCKEFIDMHKSKIWVESEVNCGSVFSFTLPEVFSEELANCID